MIATLRHFGVDLLPEAVDDMNSVPDEVRTEALAALWDVLRGRIRGRPLGARPDQGLEPCRRLYLGNADWRLVYIELPRARDAVGFRGVLVITVGPRARGAVYDTAAHRLRALRDALTDDVNPLAAAARSRPTQQLRTDAAATGPRVAPGTLARAKTPEHIPSAAQPRSWPARQHSS